MWSYQVAMVIGNSDEREPEVMTTVEASSHRDAMRVYFAKSLHPRTVTQRQIHASMVGDSGNNQDSNFGLHFKVDGVEYIVTDMDIVNTNRPIETATEDGGNMVITDVKIPDYADIMRLENMVWNATALRTDYLEYGKLFHQLATEYTEDVLIDCIEQYNSGHKW